MEAVFLKLVNMSVAAGWLILAVILVRLLLKRAPKAIHCVLWALVAVRLLCPVSPESALSLVPRAEPVSPEILDVRPSAPTSQAPALNQGVSLPASGTSAAEEAAGGNPGRTIASAAAAIWAAGAAALLLYAAVSYLRVRARVRTAVRLEPGVWQSEGVDSPFILGVIRPRIYLPFGLDPERRSHVLAHERAHLKRRDHWWKPLGFVLLAVYWFNPLVWIAYVLLCRDIELACDEKVVRELGAGERRAYSEALLSCSLPRRAIAACPLAFGEVGVKKRIKAVLCYKKPAFWVIAAAAVAGVVLAVCFLTDPAGPRPDLGEHPIVSASCFDVRGGVDGETARELNQAQIEELTSRLEGLRGAKRSDRFAGLTPAYQISARREDGAWIRVSGYALDSPDSVDVEWGGKRYAVTDRDFCGYLSRICAGGDTAGARAASRLTLADVLALSQKGEALSWENFASFAYEEVGSGLYIRYYEIDPVFSLLIGGGDTGEPPMYLRLRAAVEPEDFIDIRTEDVAAFLSRHSGDRLDAAISAAVLAHNSPSKPDGLLRVESHRILAQEKETLADGGRADRVTAYTLVLYQAYSPRTGENGELELAEGSLMPTVLTFALGVTGDYTLTDYWTPREGQAYAEDVRARFPAAAADNALDGLMYLDDLSRECREKGLALLRSQGGIEGEIAGLLEEICRSPAASSRPGDYIDAHRAAYDQLVAYGEDTLRYCFGQFLLGGQTDLRGHIMAAVCREIAADWGETLISDGPPSATGQDWFDRFRSNAQELAGQSGGEVPRAYPASRLLLELSGRAGPETEWTGSALSVLLPLDFTFSSGAGAWDTTLTLHPDGSFEGVYHDADMGVSGPDFPNGTLYLCTFSGRFGGVTRIGDHAFSMTLEKLETEHEAGEEWIADGVRHIASEPYGIAGGGEFILYLPETLAVGLPGEFLSWWPDQYLWREGSQKTLSRYGLLNVNTGAGFFTGKS